MMQSGTLLKQQEHDRLERTRKCYIRFAQHEFIKHLLIFGFGTADDVHRYVTLPVWIDPKCLGAVPRALKIAGVISAAGVVASTRPERHAAMTTLWTLRCSVAAHQWRIDHPLLPLP